MKKNLEFDFLKRNLELTIQYSDFWIQRSEHITREEVRPIALLISDAIENLQLLEDKLLKKITE